jgi:hypothetical protein
MKVYSGWSLIHACALYERIESFALLENRKHSAAQIINYVGFYEPNYLFDCGFVTERSIKERWDFFRWVPLTNIEQLCKICMWSCRRGKNYERVGQQ